jgi:Chaperone of endosialidase
MTTKSTIRLVLLTTLTVLFNTSVQAQVKIGQNPTVRNANSELEIESTTRGLLLPRLALTSTSSFAPMTTHVAGMVAYNTATTGDVVPAYYYNDGTKWVQIGASSNDWKITGNAATTPPTQVGTAVGAANYWGTSDAKNLALGTNATTRMIFDQKGNAFGGNLNTMTADSNTFVWGGSNRVTANANNSLVVGHLNVDSSNFSLVFGLGNTLGAAGGTYFNSNRGTILGGGGNVVVAGQSYNSIINGSQNNVYGGCSESIITGYLNTVSNSQKVVINGQSNTITDAPYSIVFGSNNASSSVLYGLAHGRANTINKGADYGIALGESNTIATNHLNSMAIGKGVTTTATNQFAANYLGGYKFFSTSGATTATTANVVIQPDGRVGIGTEAPVYNLDIVGTVNGNVASRIWNKSNGTNAAAILTFGNDIAPDAAYIFKTSNTNTSTPGANNLIFGNVSGDMLFLQNGGEKMRITAAGNIGIGTATPTQRLDVVGIVNATNYTATSDARLKTNIVGLEQGTLNKVLQLKPVAYDKKETLESTDYNRKEIGFIAQDLRKLFPIVVQENGKDKLLSVNYTALIPVLTKAIQEQQAASKKENDALKQQIAQLKAQLDGLAALATQVKELQTLVSAKNTPTANEAASAKASKK